MVAESPKLQITAVPLPMAAALLSKASPQPVTVELLEETCGFGAPHNADGSINLIHFAAWLVRELSVGH